MSTRQKGNVSENSVMEMAKRLGYATFAARGSRGVVDVLCFQESAHHRHARGDPMGDHSIGWKMVPLAIQVGPAKKPIQSTLYELEAAPRPIGSLVIVARKTKLKNGRVKWLFSTPHGKYASLEEAVNGR